MKDYNVPIKEDGSLDVEYIRNLPFEERMEVVACLSDKHLKEYVGDIPYNDNPSPIIPIVVDYGYDDIRSGVDAFEFMKEMREKYLKR